MLELVLLLAGPFTPAQKDAFIICYDTEHQRPFWTAHQLIPGQPAAPRKHWRKDHELNSLSATAFTNSGFDRGHLVAAADAPESNDTFLTSNAIAQNPKLNRGKWRRIENRIRRANQPAIIITGAFDWSCDNKKSKPPAISSNSPASPTAPSSPTPAPPQHLHIPSRDMRLPVDKDCDRMDAPATADQIDRLTAVANENCKDFVAALQCEIRDSLSRKPGTCSATHSYASAPPTHPKSSHSHRFDNTLR